jgi:hypothetical protein
MTTISSAKDQTSIQKTPQIKPVTTNLSGISQEVIDEISEEINNMLSYAVYNGILINTEVNSLVQNSSVDDLINAHNLLCKNIAPVTPKSITFLKQTIKNGSNKSFMNKLPGVRNLLLLSVFFLLLFIGSGMSVEVNNSSLDKGILGNNGFPLLINLIYLAAISGMGVLFFLLKNISTAVKNGTLIPEDSIEYSTQIILGIISGVIMSEIISDGSIGSESVTLLNKGGLALIGGFSADAIFSILKGLIDKIKNIFITPKK